MLTLTRRSGERVLIGSQIEIRVLEVTGGRVRIGITAPRQMPVHRGELVDRIERENKRAAERKVEANGPQKNILQFPDGLYGMAGLKSWLICEIGDGTLCRALVSVDDPMVQLLLVEAGDVFPTYPVADAKQASGLAEEEVAIAVVVTAPADGSPATANLVAPIVIGLETRKGVQVILERSDLGMHHPLGMGRSELSTATGAKS